MDAAKEAIGAEAAVAAQLDDLFHQIDESAVPEATTKSPAQPPSAKTEAIGATAAEVDAALAAGTGPLLPPLDPDAIEEQAEKNERAALDASVEAVAAVGAELDAQQGAESDELPIYLRPLEWINAPLDHCPAPSARRSARSRFSRSSTPSRFSSTC